MDVRLQRGESIAAKLGSAEESFARTAPRELACIQRKCKDKARLPPTLYTYISTHLFQECLGNVGPVARQSFG